MVKQLLESSDPQMTFCGLELTQYLVYDNTTNINLIQQAVCTHQLNLTVLLTELSTLGGSSQQSQVGYGRFSFAS